MHAKITFGETADNCDDHLSSGRMFLVSVCMYTDRPKCNTANEQH
jgi:hypothetical protein